jgi:L-ribulokinase
MALLRRSADCPAMTNALALGIDFGTDSVRALLVDVKTGQELSSAVSHYARWAAGAFCDASSQRFRQHPQDHLDSMQAAVRGALAKAPRDAGMRVCGIGVDTTGSSPLPVAADCTALALSKDFAADPDALCVLWKDHTAVAEAEEINALAHGGTHADYTRWSGGIYSSEWFWSKILHISRVNPRVAKAAHAWVEHCDWVPAVLCGITDPDRIRRSRCAAGHKAMWHAGWGGLPDARFLAALDRRLPALRQRLYDETWTSDTSAGRLGDEWARRFGLPIGVPVAVGAFDAHLGAVGAGAGPYDLAKVMGTSTCDMLMAPPRALGRRPVRGICGQVDGSIMPGMIGLEAGQSAFGDVYAWWRKTLFAGIALAGGRGGDADAILPALTAQAAALPPGAGGLVALDWFNGRRTPDADARARAAIAGLHLGHGPAHIFRALVESTANGARAILERFEDGGVPVKRVLALGGIARKSPLAMQICADVMQRPIAIVASDQCCALGSAIAGATVGGAYRSMAAAQKAMASRIERTVKPAKAQKKAYDALYARYLELGTP